MDTDNSKQLKAGHLLQGGKYKITKFLGQGSFGITYLAEHTYLGKKVAIKEFFMKELNNRGDDGSITGMSDSSLSYNYCQKFKKEAINLSQLEHPNIVNVSDLFTENGTFYYVMDFIEGQDLKKYIVKHPLSEGEAVNIIKCVAEALIYMHETKRMLHLDLKPGNIMCRDSDGHIFLIDFGLSKHFDKNGEPESSTTIGGGTPGYAPIEQANQAKNGEFRPTIDVYALGATLYKLLTGATPPDASILVSDPKLIENNLRSKGVSERLIPVITEAMCPNVRMRTQTVRDFIANLSGTASTAYTNTKATASTAQTTQRVAPASEETTVLKTDNENQTASHQPNPSSSSPSITNAPTDGHGFFVNNEYVNTKNTSIHLFTLNGCGTRLRGNFREVNYTYVAYEFLCFLWLPIIPIGCYRVSDSGDGYKVYGSTEWHIKELLLVYLKWWILIILFFTYTYFQNKK